MKFQTLLRYFAAQKRSTATARPYFNHSIEFKKSVTPLARIKVLESVGFNIFSFPAEFVTGSDLLSDSGTTTMTSEQWSVMHLGDDAYGSNRGYFLLLAKIKQVFGEGFAPFIFHQGRPAEDALFTLLGKLSKGQIIPSNGHFDTTSANMEANGIEAVNLFSKELNNPESDCRFKGNMDILQLTSLLEKKADCIPLIYITITNNTGGGQPVSMENIREVHQLSRKFKIPLFFDACRFAENAWFIKHYEKGFQTKSIKTVIGEIFSYADGFTISFKKDGLVNMGGGLFLKTGGLLVKKYPLLPFKLMDYQITKEGHPTYGGMSGRDIMALVVGLGVVTEREEYLTYRISQVRDFGMAMKEAGIPVVTPIGGHAVYLDVDKFFEGTKMQPENFAGISFTAMLLGVFGHRACELGNFAFGRYDTKLGKEILPKVNFVRFAVPRLRYERQDLESVVEAVKALYLGRENIPKVRVVYGRDLPLRHFKAKFELI